MEAKRDAESNLYLVRHGQTALNAEGRLRGLANPPLDELGVLEARRLAGALIEHAPFLVFSSPLERAVTTAQIIAERAGVENHPDERFNDRDYGPQTGRLKSEVVDAAEGVEPTSNVLARALPALQSVVEGAGGISVIVVTHDAVIRPVIEALDRSLTDLIVPTGSWNHLVLTGTRWSVVAVDQKPAPD
jgi:broad specificity phosphatase PhoE